MSYIEENKLSIKEFDGEGLSRAAEYGSWFVAIKNYKPANDVDELSVLEKHLETDEVFVLLKGACTLVVDKSEAGDCRELVCVPMELDKVYCVKKNVYHTTVVAKGAKMILVENSDTSADNSEFHTIAESQAVALKAEIKEKHMK